MPETLVVHTAVDGHGSFVTLQGSSRVNGSGASWALEPPGAI